MKRKIMLLVMCALACISVSAQRATSKNQIKASEGIRVYGDLMVSDQKEPIPGIHTYLLWQGSPESGNFYNLVSASSEMNEEFINATAWAFYHRGSINTDSALVVDGGPLNAITIREQLEAFKKTSGFPVQVAAENTAIANAKDAIATAREERRKHFPFFTKQWREQNRALKKATNELQKAQQAQLEGQKRRAALLVDAENLFLQMKDEGYAGLTGSGILPITEITGDRLPTRIHGSSPHQSPQSNQQRTSPNPLLQQPAPQNTGTGTDLGF